MEKFKLSHLISLENVANLVTLLGLPITLLTLIEMFKPDRVSSPVPTMPGESAFLLVGFFLLSLAFAFAFANFFLKSGTEWGWTPLVTFPLFSLLSVSQSFVAIEIFFGRIYRDVGSFWFGSLLAFTMVLEVYYICRFKPKRVEILIAVKLVLFALMGILLAHDALPYFSDTKFVQIFSFTLPYLVLMVAGSFAVYRADENGWIEGFKKT